MTGACFVVTAGAPQFFWFGYACNQEEDFNRRIRLKREYSIHEVEQRNLKEAEKDKADSLAVYVSQPNTNGFNNVEYFNFLEIKRITGYEPAIKVK